MSDEHEHPHKMHYTVYLAGHWWQGTRTLKMIGTGSSVKDGELLIFGENGTLTSINFNRVVWMRAEKV